MAQAFIIVVMIALSPGSSTQVLVPKSEFRRTTEPNCPVAHLHANHPQGVLPLIALADPDDRIPDPDMMNCGYGELRALSVLRVPNPPLPGDSDHDGIPDSQDPAPFDADADDDGVPDGMSDTDGDGLTDEFEIQVSMTDPSVRDSNMDGTDDGVEYGLANFDGTYTHVPAAFGALRFSGLDAADMAGLLGRFNKLGRLANLRYVPSVYMENVPEDFTGGMSDGVITAPDERFVLEQHFNEWLAMNTNGGEYFGFAAPNYSPSTSNSRGYGRTFQPSVFARADLTDDLKVAISVRYSLLGKGLREPGLGTPGDVDSNLLVDASRLESEVNLRGLSNLMLTDMDRAFLGFKNPYRFFGRQTRVMGFDVSPVMYGRGLVFDAYDDSSGAGYTDLDYAAIDSSPTTDDVILALSFFHEPSATDIVLNTRIEFDTDDDSLADISFVLERSRKVGEETVSRVYSTDFRTFASEPQLNPFRLSVRYNWDAGELGAGDLYLMHLSMAEINPTVDVVPVDVFVEDENGTLVDQSSFDWDRIRYMMDPAITSIGRSSGYPSNANFAGAAPNGALGGVQYLPGESVSISFVGLTPLTTFDLSVDEIAVLQETTDASGNFSGSFQVPSGAPAGNRFLTARDATGEFAGSILVVPEAGSARAIATALCALALLSTRLRRRN